MKSVAVGVVAAIVALGLFFSGFLVGANVAIGNNSGYVKYLNERAEHGESAQMQCIHWVDQWKGEPTVGNQQGAPTFGMYTALCGKPDSK
jgi:hypothetical protein